MIMPTRIGKPEKIIEIISFSEEQVIFIVFQWEIIISKNQGRLTYG